MRYPYRSKTCKLRLSDEPLNAFEAEVFDCLSAKGLKLIPQMAIW
jgi:hypothetical protein